MRGDHERRQTANGEGHRGVHDHTELRAARVGVAVGRPLAMPSQPANHDSEPGRGRRARLVPEKGSHHSLLGPSQGESTPAR